MKLKPLHCAMILSLLPTGHAFAAAMDRSGQSIAAFLQPNNYFEFGISAVSPDVTGTVRPDWQPNLGLGGTSTGQMGETYYFPNAALKIQATDQISVGLLYDQPFGAEAAYPTNTPALGNLGVFHDGQQGTDVSVRTQNLSLLFGYQPDEHWNFYAGPAYQTVKANVNLRGLAYGGPRVFGKYDLHIAANDAWGWLAGVAYQVPEIALKTSVTYRSKISHKVNADESINGNSNFASSGKTDVTTPQSLNIDLQSGIMANTVAFLNMRWVDWSSFSIRPYQFGLHSANVAQGAIGTATEFNLVDYSKDQYSALLGLGYKFNPKVSGSVSVGWDSGAGNPVTTLGPTDGYWSLGIGGQYSPEENYFIQAGVRYFWLGSATARSGSYSIYPNPDVANIADFSKSSAWGYMLKLGYRF